MNRSMVLWLLKLLLWLRFRVIFPLSDIDPQGSERHPFPGSSVSAAGPSPRRCLAASRGHRDPPFLGSGLTCAQHGKGSKGYINPELGDDHALLWARGTVT